MRHRGGFKILDAHFGTKEQRWLQCCTCQSEGGGSRLFPRGIKNLALRLAHRAHVNGLWHFARFIPDLDAGHIIVGHLATSHFAIFHLIVFHFFVTFYFPVATHK